MSDVEPDEPEQPVQADSGEQVGDRLAARPIRVCLPDSHTPMSASLEKEYYPDDDRLLADVRSLWGQTAGLVAQNAA